MTGNENKKRIVNYFKQTKSKPRWLLFKYLPVIPPNIRPIVKLQDKLIIITDLNFLYANILNINNKIKKLHKMSVPKNFINGEKYVLQTKVDQLLLNSKNQNKSKLKSITENLQGKKGRIRENILGKTVDYSGRSVIVVGPNLELNKCGIPREIVVKVN
jgi:DNA-directed RNA polymerase subunit beta'